MMPFGRDENYNLAKVVFTIIQPKNVGKSWACYSQRLARITDILKGGAR